MPPQHRDEEDDSRDRLVVLLRHGIAEDKAPDKTDEERSLTAEGHARMMVIAQGLEQAFPRAQVIWSSPLLRATQTALWVSKAYRSRIKVQVNDALRPESTPAEFAKFLRSVVERRIILVGHEPSLSAAVIGLTGVSGERDALELKKGGCYALRFHANANRATLEWLLSPRILRKLGE
jgi:phosphohistidine phosphatase